MEEEIKQLRILAVQRFKSGENPESIYISLGKSRFRLYKWVKGFDESDPFGLETVRGARDKFQVEVISMPVRHLRPEKPRHDLGMFWAVGDFARG